MTSLNEAREAIYARFVDAWADETPYVLGNEESDATGRDEWARLTVRHRSGGGQETLGAAGKRRFERPGAAFVEVYTPSGSGTQRSDALVTRAREAFEGLTLAGTTVSFRDVDVRESGPDGKWYRVVVEAIFRYDETR